ncbi:unnamed protein product [Periconia digitata]|uniref:Mtf2-like C-terminal domain-containing protein n=1 Tax=Periconia digitata TaxID=1303443 RepID=A0A9W4XKG3_9PLEO|nr:unnamed protein product [Periconia digitata]
MSICWCGHRAISRSPLQPAKTLAPFLYQTATLLQCRPDTHPIARRHASSRPRYDHDVPFENDLQSTAAEQEPPRNTTITGSERMAFRKLYNKFTAPKDDFEDFVDKYQGGKETTPEKEHQDLDSLFDDVMSGRANKWRESSSRQRLPPKKKSDNNIASLAASILNPGMKEAEKEAKRLAEQQAAELLMVQEEERRRIHELFDKAKTDHELWKILKEEVFEPISSLDLDSDGGHKKEDKPSKPTKMSKPAKQSKHSFPTSPVHTKYQPSAHKPSPKDAKVLFHNYPTHLIAAAKVFDQNFPASSLIFSILPFLKSQGRSAYALGATEELYNNIIRITWQKNASYSQVCNLLQEMDNGGIELKHRILEVIELIQAEHEDATSGRMGQPLAEVVKMELYIKDMQQLIAWKNVVRKRLGMADEPIRRTPRRIVGKEHITLSFQ